jgi:hypothetical protein
MYVVGSTFKVYITTVWCKPVVQFSRREVYCTFFSLVKGEVTQGASTCPWVSLYARYLHFINLNSLTMWPCNHVQPHKIWAYAMRRLSWNCQNKKPFTSTWIV